MQTLSRVSAPTPNMCHLTPLTFQASQAPVATPSVDTVSLSDARQKASIAGNANANPFESSVQLGSQRNVGDLPQVKPVHYGPLIDLCTPKPMTGGNGRLNLVLEGDSLTVGYGPVFQSMMNGEVVNTYSDAVSGEKITDMLGQVGELSKKYDPNAKDNLMVLWAGTNDLCWGQGGDPIRAFKNLQALAGAYSEQGFKVMVLTMGYTRPLSHAKGMAYDALIWAADGPWDAVLDLSRVQGLCGNLKNDMVHYTPEGYQQIADEVEKSLIKLGWLE